MGSDMDITSQIDSYFSLEQEIFAHCGYKPDWVSIPLEDTRDYFWQVDPTEKRELLFAKDRETLLRSEEWNPALYSYLIEGEYYQEVIYTQRFLKKWVYRGEKYTLVCADTQTDGNKFLRLFDNTKEVPWDASKRRTSEQRAHESQARWEYAQRVHPALLRKDKA